MIIIISINAVYIVGTQRASVTHRCDHGVRAFLRFIAGTQFMEHAGARASAPHTVVPEVRVLTQAAVLSAQRAVIQCDCGTRETNKRTTHGPTPWPITRNTSVVPKYIKSIDNNTPFNVLSTFFSVYLSLMWNRMLVSRALS